MVTGPLVDYLSRSTVHEIHTTIASLDAESGAQLAKKNQRVSHVLLNVQEQTAELDALIKQHDIVVSLLPAPMHPAVADLCVKNKVNMVTTSYISPAMQSLDASAQQAGITILNEIGLDPGIDHLTAMHTIDSVHSNGGRVISSKQLSRRRLIFTDRLHHSSRGAAVFQPPRRHATPL